MDLFGQIKEAGWLFPYSEFQNLTLYDKSFIQKEFTGQRTVGYYKNRLRHIGFNNMTRVLDAACGMGQWSIALSILNHSVECVDLSKKRLGIAWNLRKLHRRSNCRFLLSNLESLPFQDSSFDGIFCYGAFMFTNMRKTLQEFKRLLRSHGKLYFNVNAIGWYAHLLIDFGLRHKRIDLIHTVLHALSRNLLGKSAKRIVTKNWLTNLLDEFGFKIKAIALEGHISILHQQTHPSPAYPSKFYGLPSIYEVLAIHD